MSRDVARSLHSHFLPDMTIQKRNESICSLADLRRLAPPKDPDKQWKAGRSAMESAVAWLAAPDRMPPEIALLLSTHPDLGALSIERIEPEALISFDEHGGPRNADVAVLAHDNIGKVAITVEAKADEAFDQPLADVLGAALERGLANPDSKGVDRAVDLARALLHPKQKGDRALKALRYQLFTGVAGTLAMADRHQARRAVFVVQEFVTSETSQAKLKANARDFAAFVHRLSQGAIAHGRDVASGVLYGPFAVPGQPLFSKPAALYIGKAVRMRGAPRP